MKRVLIVIPARYASTRLPGKPLQKIAGIEMIRRVAMIAESLCCRTTEPATPMGPVATHTVGYVVATDDIRVAELCAEYRIPCRMTDAGCRSGTERCRDIVRGIAENPIEYADHRSADHPDLIVNLQGDNPLCPPGVIQCLINAWLDDDMDAANTQGADTSPADAFTPCLHLSWEAYDRLVESKRTTPYSGTTVLVNHVGDALAFSKTLIPTIRKPDSARVRLTRSPVRQHIGLYAYLPASLERYFSLPECEYESGDIEGLEQMRFLVAGMRIRVVEVDPGARPFIGGVDSPEDILRTEAILREYGES